MSIISTFIYPTQVWYSSHYSTQKIGGSETVDMQLSVGEKKKK